LKKNGTPAAWHWSRIDTTQDFSSGRAPGPLSPPAITQWIGHELGGRSPVRNVAPALAQNLQIAV